MDIVLGVQECRDCHCLYQDVHEITQDLIRTPYIDETTLWIEPFLSTSSRTSQCHHFVFYSLADQSYLGNLIADEGSRRVVYHQEVRMLRKRISLFVEVHY